MQMRWNRGVTVTEEGVIKISKWQDEYNPFDHYYPTGSSAEDGAKSLYLEFASLRHDEESVHEFVEKYGLLGLAYRQGLSRDLAFAHCTNSEGPDHARHDVVKMSVGTIGITVEDFDEFVATSKWMALLVDLWGALKAQNVKRVRELMLDSWKIQALGGLGMAHPLVLAAASGPYHGDVTPQAVIGGGWHWLLNWLDDELAGMVWPSLVMEWPKTTEEFVTGSPKQVWVANTLLAAMYAMLQQDMTGELPAKRCKNGACRKFFIPQRSNNEFCHKTCGNAYRQREYRKQGKAH